MEGQREDHAATATKQSTDANRAYANNDDADGFAKTSPPLSMDEERLQKAESFLRNGEIENVPTSAKREFLEKKAGMSSHEVDVAMERVAKKGGLDRLDVNRDFERKGSDDRYRSGEIEYHDRGRGPGKPRRYEDDFLDERDSYRIRHARDYSMDDRRGPVYETTPQYSQPLYSANHPISQGVATDQIEEQRSRSSEYSFFSWAGGFSLGVVCLAALRWLNGGDFVLFPPPSASDSIHVRRRHIEKEHQSDGNDAEETIDPNVQEEDVTPLLEDIIEENGEEAESDLELNDEALRSILNGTANAQYLHPADTQPSYKDLVLEIRALTSAVHSYREEQERANRATAAKVGRGLTDDVMDLLREDKKNKDESTLPSRRTESAYVWSIRSVLKEISDDLIDLKQCLSKSDECNNEDADNDGNAETEGSEPIESTCRDEKLSDETSLLKVLDRSMEKLQKVIDVIEESKEDQTDEKTTVVPDEATTSQLPLPIEETTLVADSESVDDSSLSLNARVEAESSPEVEPNTRAVEQALKTLSSTNRGDDLTVGAQMLYLYCMNISKNPSIPRYRKIYTNNNTFQKKVGNLNGAKELLCAVGFVEKKNFFEWANPSDTSMDTEASLDLALVALDMMRKGNKTVEETSSQTLHEEPSYPNETILPSSAVTSSSD